MKNKIGLWAVVALTLVFAFSLAACDFFGSGNIDVDPPPENTLHIEQVYAMAVDAGYTGTLEELIEAFQGANAFQIAIQNGYTGTEAEWLVTLVGASGTNGTNGITPHIGDNGNWFIGEVDTGVKAVGTDGITGGDGLSAYEIYLKYYPEYLLNENHSEEDWINDFILGRLIQYTVHFDAQNSDDVISMTAYAQKTIPCPSAIPQKTNYIFTKWFTDSACTTEWRFDTALVNGDLTLYAGYTVAMTYAPVTINGINGYAVTGFMTTDTAYTTLEIPAEHDGLPVLAIGNAAFKNITHLTNIHISDNILSIGTGAFSGCNGLTYVNLPSGLATIGDEAFSGCTSLTSLIHNSRTFSGSPWSILTSVGEQAFAGCTSLGQVLLPSGLASIGEQAFAGCTNLIQIELLFGLTSVGEQAFAGCTSLSQVLLPSGLASIGDEAFTGCTSLTYINLPDGLASIGNETFAGCAALKRVNLPEGLTFVGAEAFANCVTLTQLSIPASVFSIGDRVLYNCPALTAVIVDFANRYYRADGGVLFNKERTALIQYLVKSDAIYYSVPDTVQSIADYAFAGCESLAKIRIPISVNAIGTHAFAGCPQLQIYSAAAQKPATWNDSYNPDNCAVTFGWGYADDQTRELIFAHAVAAITLPVVYNRENSALDSWQAIDQAKVWYGILSEASLASASVIVDKEKLDDAITAYTELHVASLYTLVNSRSGITNWSPGFTIGAVVNNLQAQLNSQSYITDAFGVLSTFDVKKIVMLRIHLFRAGTDATTVIGDANYIGYIDHPDKEVYSFSAAAVKAAMIAKGIPTDVAYSAAIQFVDSAYAISGDPLDMWVRSSALVDRKHIPAFD